MALTVAALLTLCQTAVGQLSLSAAVDIALRSDPRVRMAEANVEKARASLSQARDAYIPSATLTGGDGKSVGVPTSLPVIFSASSQSLLFTVAQYDYVKAAHSGLESAQLALEDSRAQAMEDAANTYVSLDNAEHRNAALVAESGYAARLEEITRDRLSAGQGTQMDWLQTKRTVAQIRLARMQVEDEVAILSDHLARLIGLPGNALQTNPDSIPEMRAELLAEEEQPESPGVRAAFVGAEAKHRTARGDSRYILFPQISFGAGYSRISEVGTNYYLYYPAFNPGNIATSHLSLNALSFGVQVQIPLFDKAHYDHGVEGLAEARRAKFEAESQRNQFLEGRFKLSRSVQEAGARAALAKADVDIAQAKIDIVEAQLTAESGNESRPQMSPKDEQAARLDERQRYVEYLDAELTLGQSQISLLRQRGELADWLRPLDTGQVKALTPAAKR